ncbi:ABC transporter ATP-binding protein [Georgenia sp. H159]|uniref:ABC transporter ATP-binding protein n=1 Tax=Georgenia sp. H159 TaxID=3076115 RepID=UPI002D79C6ED|nr:ABC transporter ATP-binding protein [Georgenia sp. H159]
MAELELRGITKRFPGVLANDRIDLTVAKGEIHALMGENGAGKSTLMSILYGLHRPDEGEIWLRGERREFGSPIDAIDAGLGMVFQAFKLFPSLTVAENVVYRAEVTRRGLLDRQAANRRVAEIADRYGLAVDPAARVDQVPVGVLQRVEIVKALYRDAQVLILDEPTAVLTPQEADKLFGVLRALADDGRTIIFITHKLKEVLAISDRVTVLRDGRAVATLTTGETDAAEIARHMTGRDVELQVWPPAREPGAPVLECEGLHAEGADGRVALDDVSLTVRAGEVVGIAGVAGNGQAELAEVVAGLRPVTAGSIRISGADVTAAPVAVRRSAGLAYIPEDRHDVGTAPAADTTDNLSLGHHRRPPLVRRGLLQRGRMVERARRLITNFQIKVSGPDTLVGTLSGGNLQKIVVARELDHGSPLLIAEQPTRGVDIGAIQFMHGQIAQYRDRGGAVLLISAELSEILTLSGRILVMFEGRVVAELDAATATEAQLGLLMAGGGTDPTAAAAGAPERTGHSDGR